MSDLTRYPNGIAQFSPGTPFGDLAIMPPVDRYSYFFNDFVEVPTGITHTQTNGTLNYVGPTGLVTQTLGGADNDLSQIYLPGNVTALQAGKQFGWQCRLRITTGANLGQEEWFSGASIVQTGTNFMAADGSVRTFDRGIGFISYDGSGTFDVLQGDSDTFTTGGLSIAYVSDTWMTLAFWYDGTRIRYYVNGVKVATLSTNIPAGNIAPLMQYVKAGEAAVKVLTTDYVMCASER